MAVPATNAAAATIQLLRLREDASAALVEVAVADDVEDEPEDEPEFEVEVPGVETAAGEPDG
jgi:hypothetical protein